MSLSESRKRSKLKKFLIKDLKRIVKQNGVKGYSKWNKSRLIDEIVERNINISAEKSTKVKREMSEERKQVLREQLKKAREKRRVFIAPEPSPEPKNPFKKPNIKPVNIPKLQNPNEKENQILSMIEQEMNVSLDSSLEKSIKSVIRRHGLKSVEELVDIIKKTFFDNEPEPSPSPEPKNPFRKPNIKPVNIPKLPRPEPDLVIEDEDEKNYVESKEEIMEKRNRMLPEDVILKKLDNYNNIDKYKILEVIWGIQLEYNIKVIDNDDVLENIIEIVEINPDISITELTNIIIEESLLDGKKKDGGVLSVMDNFGMELAKLFEEELTDKANDLVDDILGDLVNPNNALSVMDNFGMELAKLFEEELTDKANDLVDDILGDLDNPNNDYISDISEVKKDKDLMEEIFDFFALDYNELIN